MNVARECVASLADAGCVLPSWFEVVPPSGSRGHWRSFPATQRNVPWFSPREDHSRHSQKFSFQSFRVLFLRGLHLPLPLSSRNCRPVWPSTRLPWRWVLGRRGFAVESAIARICREGGARVSLCGIWISDRSTTSMAVVWRSWQMGCHCLVGPSWQLTQLLFQPCVGMALQGKRS